MNKATFEFDWVDAFTDKQFGGNACAVVHGADQVSVDDRMRLVRETSLSECAYLVASDRADFGARYYLAGREILMAGHPTIATVASLLSRRMVALSGGVAEFTLEVGAGVLPISVERDGEGNLDITMTQLKPVFGNQHDPVDIASMYGLDTSDILGIPQTVSTGTGFGITVLRDKAALRRAVLDIGRLQTYVESGKGDFNEPFLVTIGGETAEGGTYSRLLLPPPMPVEDPFTGSATGCMAAYVWANGLINSPRFVAEQGHWMGRPGQAQVEVLGPRAGVEGIRVGGRGYVLMSGELYL